MAELAEDFPEEAVRCLQLLIESKSNRMGVRAWADPAGAVISSALRQPGEAQAIAKAILETLGRLGEGDLFRELAQ